MQDFPKIAVRRLQKTAPVIDSHPEPELLAAFSERSLTQPERSRVMEHLALCSDCRQIIAFALPEDDMAAVAPLAMCARTPRLSWNVLRWAVPSAVVLAIVSLAVVQNEQSQKRAEQAFSTSAPHAEIAEAQGLSSSETPPAPPIPTEQKTQMKKRALRYAENDLHGRPVPVPSPNQKIAVATSPGTQRFQSPNQAVITARNQAPDELIQNRQPSDSDVVKAKAALPQTSDNSVPAPANAPLQTSSLLTLPASPSWGVTATGRLQRSFDVGKTWEDVDVNAEGGKIQSKPVFRSVAVIGPEVWAGGAGAVLYYSADYGTRWQQILPSATATPVGDITDIEFSDPQHGKLSTSTGEIWSTSDNGQTWQQQQ